MSGALAARPPGGWEGHESGGPRPGPRQSGGEENRTLTGAERADLTGASAPVAPTAS